MVNEVGEGTSEEGIKSRLGMSRSEHHYVTRVDASRVCLPNVVSKGGCNATLMATIQSVRAWGKGENMYYTPHRDA